MPPDEIAPAAPPTAPAPATPSPEAAPSTNFDNLGSAEDLDSVEIPSAEPVAEPQVAQPPPGAPPTAAPPQQPPQQQAVPPQQAQPTPAQAPDISSPQGLVEQLAQHRGAVLQALAADRFKLSQEEVTALDTDAVGAIPGIMARVYYEAMQSTLLQIQNLVPRLVEQVLQVQRSHDVAENSFYQKFPALPRDKVQQDVLAMAMMFRQANPRITQEELFRVLGAAVAAKHGISLMPQAANGTGRPPQAPFVPAQPGAHVKITPEAESPWAGLGKDFDE